MKPEDFISKVNHSLQTGNVDKDLLSHESRFLRSKYILRMIENVSSYKKLSLLELEDLIIKSLKEKPTIDLFCIKKSNYKFNNEL